MKLNPFAGTYLENPAAIWRELLDDSMVDGGRVRYAEDLDLWLIFRYADVRRALGDQETFRNFLTLAPVYPVCPHAMETLSALDAPPTTAAADPPVHPRTRRALRTAFATTAARTDERYGAIVRRRTDELIDRLAARLTADPVPDTPRPSVPASVASPAMAPPSVASLSVALSSVALSSVALPSVALSSVALPSVALPSVDLAAELAAELPLLVILDILGVPEADVPRIKAWSDGQIALVWGNPDEAEQARLAAGLVEFWQYCRKLVADAMARDPLGGGGTDFVSRTLAYRAGDDRVLTVDEVASLAFNLLVAGHETTSGLLSHCLEVALADPDQWRAIGDGRADVPGFVEEILRMRPAIDGWLRVTARPVTFDDTTIPAGARCLLLLGAANRDPDVFVDAEVFDPGRIDVHDHLTFGYGPHFCIGASLARLEAQAVLTGLARRLPGLRLASGYTPTYHPNVGFRSHTTLPASLHPAA